MGHILPSATFIIFYGISCSLGRLCNAWGTRCPLLLFVYRASKSRPWLLPDRTTFGNYQLKDLEHMNYIFFSITGIPPTHPHNAFHPCTSPPLGGHEWPKPDSYIKMKRCKTDKGSLQQTLLHGELNHFLVRLFSYSMSMSA